MEITWSLFAGSAIIAPVLPHPALLQKLIESSAVYILIDEVFGKIGHVYNSAGHV